MIDLSNKTALVYDYGLFVCVAERLARDFGKVYYYNAAQKSAFPMSRNAWVGYGLDNIEQVDDFWDVQADLYVFPELYDADLQDELVKQGKRVWGLRRAEILETDREFLRETQVAMDMPIPETIIIRGLSVLREHLQNVEDKYVKISYYRGDAESFHHVTYDLTKPWLDDLESKLGTQADEQDFFVEDPILGIEGGVDTYVIDGQLPNRIASGFEIKDASYLGRFIPQEEVPAPLAEVNDKLQILLKRAGSRGFFSTEVRVNDAGTPFLLDFCGRCGSPPTEVLVEAYENFSEIIWEGADGHLVEPQITATHFGLVMIHNNWAAKGKWISIQVPKGEEQWVKIKNKAMKDGVIYSVPNIIDLAEIGAVVAIGSSYEDVINKLQALASEVKGYELDIRVDSLNEAMDTIKEAKNYGIDIL